jgi:hypothetical protein
LNFAILHYERIKKGMTMSYWRVFVLLLLVFFTAELNGAQRFRVAILPFDGGDAEMAQRLESTFESRLTALGRFQMVSRKELEKVFAEQSLQLSGFVDDQTVVRVGEIAGAQFIMTGRLNHSDGHWVNSQYEASVSGTVRMIDVSSATVSFSTPVLKSEKSEDKKEKAEQAALDHLVEQLLLEVRKAFPVEMFREGLRVLEKNGSWVTVAAGSDIGVEKGTIFTVQAGEKLIIDERSGEVLGREHRSGGLIKIKEVYPKYSKGYIVSGRYAFAKDAELKESPDLKILGYTARIFSSGALMQLDTNGIFPDAEPADFAYSAGVSVGYDEFGEWYMGDVNLAYTVFSQKIWALNLDILGKVKLPLVPQFIKLYPFLGAGLGFVQQELTDLAIEELNIPSAYQDESAMAFLLYGKGGVGLEITPVWRLGLAAEFGYNLALSSGLNWEVMDSDADDSDAIKIPAKYLRYKDLSLQGAELRIALVYHL